jgi:hypothetical protein
MGRDGSITRRLSMISITVLSLAPEAVQRLVAHTAREDTMCRPLERLTACGFTIAASFAALLVVVLLG